MHMGFYNQAGFWGFMASLFGLVQLYFSNKRKTNVEKASLDRGVEAFKSDYINKSIDFLNDSIGQIKPMVARHEVLMKDLNDSIKMVGVIEKGLTGQFATLSHQYESFESRITKITASYQLLLDQVGQLKEEVIKYGKIT